jgi:probable HAF family extracellular repeat protein
MGTFGGLVLVPTALNDKGQAVGTCTTTAGITRAFLWHDGVATDLGTLSGDVFAAGGAINDRGQVVGQSSDPSGFPNLSAFLWRNGVMTDLNILAPADSSLHMLEAPGINSRGEIVGWAIQNATGYLHAFLATPCDEENADDERCKATTGRGDPSQRPKIVIPENIRKMLEQRLGRRYHIPGLGTPRD